MLYPLVRRCLFTLDAERAHRLTLRALRIAGHLPPTTIPGDPVSLLDLQFPNRVGLAAGFDKIGEAVNGIGRLGFGFIEVGTVTPRPQSGLAAPRLFRLAGQKALINRMGFPNDGADACALRLRRRRFRGVVGVNIGKNADTPMERATDDYLAALRAVHGVADYVALNISSPNTASLRELHEERHLKPLLDAMVRERDRLNRASGRKRLPLLLKISPDLDRPMLEGVSVVVRESGIDGVIAANTTVQRPGVPEGSEAGGLSGEPLHALAMETIVLLRALLGPNFPIVGVGGIDSPASAASLRNAGADLVQLYTGLVYQGPRLIRACVAALQ